MKNFNETIKSLLIAMGLTIPLFSIGQKDVICEGYSASDLALLERVVKKHENQSDKMFTLETYFVLLNATVGARNEELFKKYVDEAVSLGEELLEKKQTEAKAAAYLSGIYGLKIAFSPMMAMFYGPKAGQYGEKAMFMDPEDPLVLMMYGINKYNTPSAFGGDLNEAINLLKGAASKYEMKNEQEQNWKYLHSLVWLGQGYEENGQSVLALETYKKCLEYSPNFKWAKYLAGEIEQ